MIYFIDNHGEDYRQGRIQITEDIYTAELTDCHLELLERFQIRGQSGGAHLQGEALWGLLVGTNVLARASGSLRD